MKYHRYEGISPIYDRLAAERRAIVVELWVHEAPLHSGTSFGMKASVRGPS